VDQPSCLHWKDKAPAELFALTQVYNSVPAELSALKGKEHQLTCLHWDEFTIVHQPNYFH
jgi:hypothetical protein